MLFYAMERFDDGDTKAGDSLRLVAEDGRLADAVSTW